MSCHETRVQFIRRKWVRQRIRIQPHCLCYVVLSLVHVVNSSGLGNQRIHYDRECLSNPGVERNNPSHVLSFKRGQTVDIWVEFLYLRSSSRRSFFQTVKFSSERTPFHKVAEMSQSSKST